MLPESDRLIFIAEPGFSRLSEVEDLFLKSCKATPEDPDILIAKLSRHDGTLPFSRFIISNEDCGPVPEGQELTRLFLEQIVDREGSRSRKTELRILGGRSEIDDLE
jgi:hypothetical protein